MSHRSWTAFVPVFTAFAVLLASGNLYAESSANLTLGRVAGSILLSGVLALPAVALFLLFDLSAAPPGLYEWWRWLWSFGFVAYAIHAYYAVGVWFEWDFVQIERRQTWPVAWSNYLLLAMWGCDVFVSLVAGQSWRPVWYKWFQWATLGLFVGAFVVAAVVFRSPAKSTASFGLGLLLAVVAGLTLLVRLVYGDSTMWVLRTKST
jgi:hypothetical protein